MRVRAKGNVMIGQLEQLGEKMRAFQGGGRVCVITDETVAPLYLLRCEQSLLDAGFGVNHIVIPAGEASKCGELYLRILEYLAEIPMTRSDSVVALGGGVVGDLAGFAAATYLRGIRIIQVPTTLLSAVDSSVGGKTAIDLPAGKNLAGAFHQPALVLQDVSLLSSLPENVYRDGTAEILKAGVIADEAFFTALEDPAWTKAHLADVIERAVAIKEQFVEEDEFDRGLRHKLNFGHTIGHAVEQLSGYEISHGQAVAKGMARIADISVRCGWADRSAAERIRGALERYGFDLEIPYANDAIFHVIEQDKKREGGTIDLVTLKSIGSCELRRLPLAELENIL